MQPTKPNTDRGLRDSDESNNSGYASATSTAPNSIESWLARRDQFRVVGVGHARPFPLKLRPCAPRLAQHYQAHVQSQVQPILGKYKINFNSIGLYQRVGWNESLPGTEPLHSLLIRTKDENPDTWEKAANELQEVFRHADIPSEQIEIEIFNPFKMNYNVSHAFSVDKSVLDEAKAVKPIILNQVAALCGKDWSSIAFHLRSSKCDDNVDKRPTILVFFFHGAELDFDRIESHLLETVRGCKTPFKLELLPGSIESNAMPSSGGKILEEVSRKPKNGSSIGTAGNDKEAGSLGGWFNVYCGKGSPAKVGIMCNHVVAAGTEKSTNKVVAYPAALDRGVTRNAFEAILKSETSSEIVRADFEILQHLDANPGIGKVVAASGLRTNASNRRMDWALFETPATHTRNKPPPKSAFLTNLDFPGGIKQMYTPNEDSYVRNMGVIKADSWVSKTGKTSGVTSGTVNTLTRAVHWEQHGEFYSDEIEVMGLTNDFAMGGDSGSMVMNASGELVGLLIGKDSCASDWGGGFVTPIQDILQDVKTETGGSLSLD